MKQHYVIFFLALSFLLGAKSLKADIEVTLQLEKTTAAPLETVSVEVVVSGDRNASPPELNHSPGVTLTYISYSSSVQIINMTQSSSTTFLYELSAQKEGEFEIGPAIVDIDGKKYRSDVQKIKIQKNAGNAEQNEEYFFVRATTDKQMPFAHEQVTYTFRFYNRARITNAEYQAPNFDGFWKEELGKQREFRESYKGIDWEVTELQMALFPVEAGTIRIPSAVLHVTAVYSSRGRRNSIFDDSFFGFQNTKRIALQSEELDIAVQPLPKHPQGLKTALVGNFELNAKFSQNKAKVGDSLTLTLTLSGEGNIWDSTPPALDLKDFRVYADKPNLALGKQKGVVGGKKEFKYALVPTTEGQLTIPEISFLYFNPSTQEYRVAKSSPTAIQVEPSTEIQDNKHQRFSGKEPEKKEVQVLGSDLMLWSGKVELTSDDVQNSDLLGTLLLLLGSAVMYMTALAAKKRREKLASDQSYQRKKRAYGEFKKRYQGLKDAPNVFAEVGPILRQYLSDKLNLEATSITSGEVRRLLQQTKISESSRGQIERLLRDCEQALYSGGSVRGGEAQSALLSEIVRNVEKECP